MPNKPLKCKPEQSRKSRVGPVRSVPERELYLPLSVEKTDGGSAEKGLAMTTDYYDPHKCGYSCQ